MKDLDANTRFETIGDLYYLRFGWLRPGKSEPLATMRDSNSEENVLRFEKWTQDGSAFEDAIKKIAFLEQQLEQLEDM